MNWSGSISRATFPAFHFARSTQSETKTRTHGHDQSVVTELKRVRGPVGFFQSFGGMLQASAVVAFGIWFLASLAIAYRAIRGGDIAVHRRWMIRAFAIGLAVGTIRLWIGLFEAFGLLSFRDAFGVAFWISFVMHATAAELYVRWRPTASGRPRRERASA